MLLDMFQVVTDKVIGFYTFRSHPPSTQDKLLRSAIFAKTSREKLVESIATVNELARPCDDNFHDEMVEQYGPAGAFEQRSTPIQIPKPE